MCVKTRNASVEIRKGFLLLLCLVAWGCGRAGPDKPTPELITDLKTAKGKDRIAAVRLLPQHKGDAAQVVPALIDALKDKGSDVRWSAAIGLGRFGDKAKEAIPALEKAEKDRDARVREAARVALTRIDPVRFPAPAKGKPDQK